MPGSLFSFVVTWLASHLVALSLLGFVAAGLVVSGVVAVPGVGGEETLETGRDLQPAREAEAPTVRPAPVARDLPSETDARSAKPVPQSSSAPVAELATRSKAPKLIGGSIPLYQDPRVPPASPSDPQGFRPSGAPPVPMMPPDRDELLQVARRAYWNGDFEAAEIGYMELIAQYPGDADAFGELGNVYQSMGRPAQALDAFFEAGVRLKAAGETAKLQHVIDLLTAEDYKRIDELSR